METNTCERVPHTCTNMYTCCCQIRRRSSWEDTTRSERLSDCLTSSFYNFLILCCQLPLGTIWRLPEVHILVVRFPDPPQKTLPAKWYNFGWSGWSENVHKKWFEDIFSQILFSDRACQPNRATVMVREVEGKHWIIDCCWRINHQLEPEMALRVSTSSYGCFPTQHILSADDHIFSHYQLCQVLIHLLGVFKSK